MAYSVRSYPGFGRGLNLRDKVDAVDEAEAIDCRNVEFTERGAVKQRGGYSVFTASPLSNQGDTLHAHYTTGGTTHLLVGDITSGRVTALNAAGSEVTTNAVFASGGCYGFQRFGAPGNEYTYVGNGIDELYYYDGATFTNVPDDTGAREPPKGGALALSPGGAAASNRLACARFTTGTGGPNAGVTTPSTIWFSNPGNPVIWGDNDYLHLTPGDGESIQALVNWREFLFVFKETKFFVFSGESTDADGNPVFQWYDVDTGHGAVGPRAVTADETGVYFCDRSGLMRTTGGAPEHVGELVAPIFKGGSSEFFTGGELNHSGISAVAVNAFDEKIYLNYPSSGTTNDRTLVYDPHYDWWSLWDVAAADMCSFRASAQEQLFFTYPTGDNEVARFTASDTSDAGTAITAFWRSGWPDFGMPEQKTIRETKIWGTGQLTLGVSVDYASSGFYADNPVEPVVFSETDIVYWQSGTWQNMTWGSPDATVSDQLVTHSARGTTFSTLFYNNTLDATFSVHRLDHHFRESLIPSRS